MGNIEPKQDEKIKKLIYSLITDLSSEVERLTGAKIINHFYYIHPEDIAKLYWCLSMLVTNRLAIAIPNDKDKNEPYNFYYNKDFSNF